MNNAGMILIGAGQAAAWCAKTLRAQGYDGAITMIGAEPHLPYERPPLSKELLKGSIEPASLFLMSEKELEEQNIQFLNNEMAIGLNPETRTVTTDKGEYQYEKLLIATGAKPFLPPVPGLDEPGVFVLRTLEDCNEIKHYLQARKDARVLVLGGGWIGLETASTLRGMGIEVSLVEAANRLCSRSVNSGFAEILQSKHTASRVPVLLNTQIRQIERKGNRLLVWSEQGELGAFDAVVVGTGIRPATELAEQAGIRCNHGILVDSACHTSHADIFAAGDVVARYDVRVNALLRLESWQNAQDQGVAAARSMLGQTVSYQPYPYVWSEQYDWMIQIYGYQNNQDRLVMRGNVHENKFIQFSLDENNCVKGFIAVNAGRDIRTAKKIVEAEINIDAELLQDVNVSLEKILKNTQMSGA